MRFVKLTETELITLQEGHRNGSQFQFRHRCQCLILSNQGKTVSELAEFFEVSNITIYSCFDRWEKGGIVGLLNRTGEGGKPILSRQNPRHVKTVKQAVEKNASSVKAVIAELETTLDEKMSVDTIKRFLKNLVTVGVESAAVSSRGRWERSEKQKSRL
jgi:transposase